MKRSEAFWILNEMYELANEAQKQALNIAQRDIEFVDLMPDVPVQRWIPVTERLPIDEKPVLVYYGFMHKGNAVTGLRYTGTLSYFCFDHKPHWQHESTGLIVTHWMPLPEPPKED